MTTTPSSEVTDPALNSAVERYYDTTLDLYEQMWGEHVHHGYWGPGEAPAADGGDRIAATDRLVHELAAFAGVPAGSRVLDIGCGIGGPALYLAGDLGCTVEGVTLSAAQAARAQEKADASGLGDRARFQQLDGMATGFPDGSFDVVWAMESLMHIADRAAFFTEVLRLLRPGGTVAVATWSARHGDATPEEEQTMQLILRHQVMPSFQSLEEHEELCRAAGFDGVRIADWSDAVAPSWDPGYALVHPNDRGRRSMMELARDRGVDVLGFFYAAPLMKKGYDSGVLRYGALKATKPDPSA
jgi:tocopherol O-methyltransferase